MTIEQIKSDIRKRVDSAMSRTAADATTIVEDSILSFYSGGEPEVYIRTGTLMGTPQILGPIHEGSSISVEAELSDGVQWHTGTLNSDEIIRATNTGDCGVVGSPRYWKNAEEEIIERATINIKEEFQ